MVKEFNQMFQNNKQINQKVKDKLENIVNQNVVLKDSLGEVDMR